jgi:carboxymethylenebutenolidase
MCFDPDATPPIADNGVPVTTRDLDLVAGDGNELMAFHAHPEEADAGVIVLPDVRGLYDFYKILARCFAQAGHAAVAIDYFGRTAGPGARDDDFDFWPHVEQVTHDGLRADVATAADLLRADHPERRLYTVGFCFGGSNSWHQAGNGHGLAGAVGFYGSPTRPNRPLGAPPVVDRVGEMECPVLALMAGDDPSITADDRDAFEDALTAAGIAHEIVTYDGCPHSFFDRTYDEYAEASADAWERVLGFIGGEHASMTGR